MAVGIAKDNGGAAFPNIREADDRSVHSVNDGMTLRDYFAAKALPTIIEQFMNVPDGMQERIAEWVGVDEPITSKVSAAFAYKIADAMLEARKK